MSFLKLGMLAGENILGERATTEFSCQHVTAQTKVSRHICEGQGARLQGSSRIKLRLEIGLHHLLCDFRHII